MTDVKKSPAEVLEATSEERASYDICASYGQWELEERAAGRSGILSQDDAADWYVHSQIVCAALSRGVMFSQASRRGEA